MTSNRALISEEFLRYPTTFHLEGSRLQKGDEGHDHVPYHVLRQSYVVIEEKFDGGQAGVSFGPGGDLRLQSRGHYLVGGGRERQFSAFKAWTHAHQDWLLDRLEDRYVMFGECMAKKHSMFYDRLPHHFLEFDVWDRVRKIFLSTAAREALLVDGPVLSVPVLYRGVAPNALKEVLAHLQPSLGRSVAWREAFERTVRREGLDLGRAWAQCDRSDLAEGLYIKVEREGETVGRYKWVRHDFVQAILNADKHHSEQPFVPNLLLPGVDVFAPRLTHTWASLAQQGEDCG